MHPPINPHDLKLHQFFALHRPLLTVSQPVSSIFETSTVPFAWPPAAPTTTHLGTIDDPPEASPESDADAARQLARALVVNRAGAALAWETALRRLGLDVTAEHAAEVSQAEAEFEVYMDSTKRKRRRKMKTKHKYVCTHAIPIPLLIIVFPQAEETQTSTLLFHFMTTNGTYSRTAISSIAYKDSVKCSICSFFFRCYSIQLQSSVLFVIASYG